MRQLAAAILLVIPTAPLSAGDWPQWRYGPDRGAATPDGLPQDLHLQWVLKLPTPQPAWPADQTKLQFDASYEPVVADGRMFVPSMVHDNVAAHDVDTGKELWRFYTNGPVRFAPACWQGSVFAASDDGYLYCLEQATGKLQWKFRGGPSDRRIIGNDRLISTWPARGAPVVKDGKVYFTAGVWPFMGIFIHALDADTGEVVWTNSGSGSNYLVQPHNSAAFAGVSPQGYLAANDDMLIVPGGRGVPAGYDRATGEFKFCHVGGYSKRAGGYDVMVGDAWMANRGVLCCAYAGTQSDTAGFAVKSDRHILRQSGNKLTALPAEPPSKVEEKRDRRGKRQQVRSFDLKPQWETTLPGELRQVMIQAGERVYGTDGRRVYSYGPSPLGRGGGEGSKADSPHPSPLPEGEGTLWQLDIAGTVWNMLAAEDRLFVVTREGWILCFGEEDRGVKLPAAPKVHEEGAGDGAVRLIARGADWRYLDDGSDQGGAWQAADFDDSKWAVGPAELGYGDGDERTVIEFGGNGGKKHMTYYFRREIDVDDPKSLAGLRLAAKVDDGAVFYLNGKEVARLNMPRGDVTFKTPAGLVANEKDYVRQPLTDAKLTKGKNVLAVEVHQRSPGSSDVSFDLELTAEQVGPVGPTGPAADEDAPRVKAKTLADTILAATQTKTGFATVYGVEQADLINDLVAGSDLQVIVVEPSSIKAHRARERWREAGTLGTRIAVVSGDSSAATMPPYLNSLVIGSLDDQFNLIEGVKDGNLPGIYDSLRPYGGAFVIVTGKEQQQTVEAASRLMKLPKAKWQAHERFGVLTREGPLPDSAPWTHNNADVGNALLSRDARVKLPLGLLWFGGPSNQEVLPRHGHGPTPQVVGGRLFIEGRHMLRAVDVYTGRLLWQRSLPDLGQYYDNTGHHPGAGAIGSNYVSTADGIYVAYGRKGLRLDPATGETVREFTLPKDSEGQPAYWGYIGVYEDNLIVGASPVAPLTSSHGVDQRGTYSPYAEGSSRLVVLDRKSGQVKWTRDAEFNFRHNAIVAGGGKVFVLDRITEVRLAALKRRGRTPEGKPQLLALDADTGEAAWSTRDNVFGTWLAYHPTKDLLVQATSKFRDRARDEEDSGLAVYHADDGRVVWQNDAGYGGPVLLHDEMIITQGTAFDLMTGEPVEREHPVTGEVERWTFSRNYGCNTVIGCQNLLTFRSAAAGYFDLAGDGGTGNFGGFRASCTSNLVPADGVLNAPDYTRTCTCSYQLQSSLALVHMPEAEMWTFQPMAWNGDAVQRLGINFGAPGDRRDPKGTLWVDYPSVGGRSPDVPIKLIGDKIEYFRRHASQAEADDMPWVASSGATGVEAIEITLASDSNAKPGEYEIEMYFVDPTNGKLTVKTQLQKVDGKLLKIDLDDDQAVAGIRLERQ